MTNNYELYLLCFCQFHATTWIRDNAFRHTMPGWPVCKSSRTCSCNGGGIIMRIPHKRHLFLFDRHFVTFVKIRLDWLIYLLGWPSCQSVLQHSWQNWIDTCCFTNVLDRNWQRFKLYSVNLMSHFYFRRDHSMVIAKYEVFIINMKNLVVVWVQFLWIVFCSWGVSSL